MDAIDFPTAGFQPLSELKGHSFINHAAIEKWFSERQAKKGKEKGRILAMKLFIKFTEVMVS